MEESEEEMDVFVRSQLGWSRHNEVPRGRRGEACREKAPLLFQSFQPDKRHALFLTIHTLLHPHHQTSSTIPMISLAYSLMTIGP